MELADVSFGILIYSNAITLSYDSIMIQGAAIDRILGEIVHSKCMTTPIDYVLCIGHFLGKVH